MVFKAVVGQYVSFTEGGKTKYGRVISTSDDGANVVIKRYDGGSDLSGAVSGIEKLQSSNLARMAMRLQPNFWELVENTAFSSALHPIMGNHVFGAENLSFVLADFVHEFLLKGFVEQMIDALGPSTLSGADSNAWFAGADFTDMLRKYPFIVGLQQTFQRFLFRKKWGHQIVSNLCSDAGVLLVSNYADRMFRADPKGVGYTYP